MPKTIYFVIETKKDENDDNISDVTFFVALEEAMAYKKEHEGAILYTVTEVMELA